EVHARLHYRGEAHPRVLAGRASPAEDTCHHAAGQQDDDGHQQPAAEPPPAGEGPGSRWSRRPADSSERAAVSCPAAVKATRTARIRKHTPSTASAPLPCAPSLANTCCTDDPEIVPPADRAMSPNSRAEMAIATHQPMTAGRTSRTARPAGPPSSRRCARRGRRARPPPPPPARG